jgi:hypothetical protein
MLESRDEMELIWIKEAADATWEAGREAREKNRLTSVAQLANALDHGRPLNAGLRYYRGLDHQRARSTSMADRSLIVIVATLLLVLAIVVFIVALGDYLFQPMLVQ